MSRITNNIMINNFRRNYENINKKLNDYMNKLSSGEKFSKISEAPLDGAKALKFETNLEFNEKYNSNIQSGVNWLSTTDESLSGVVTTLRRVRDMAVKAANETSTKDDRRKMKEEVEQVKNHLIQLGNSTHADRYIFNGTKTKTKPYQDGNTENSADYINDTSNGSIQREISQGINVDINISGSDVGDGGFSQIFADIKELSNAMYDPGADTTDTAAINQAIGKIDDHIEGTLQSRAKVGAKQNRLELTQNKLEAQKIGYKDILSETKDTDVAEMIMKLKNQENVYRAALSTGARTIQPSLVDFLK